MPQTLTSGPKSEDMTWLSREHYPPARVSPRRSHVMEVEQISLDTEKKKLWRTVWLLVGHFPVLRRSHVYRRRQQGQYTKRKKTSRDERWQRKNWCRDWDPSCYLVDPESWRSFGSVSHLAPFLATKTIPSLCAATPILLTYQVLSIFHPIERLFQRTRLTPGFLFPHHQEAHNGCIILRLSFVILP